MPSSTVINIYHCAKYITGFGSLVNVSDFYLKSQHSFHQILITISHRVITVFIV